MRKSYKKQKSHLYSIPLGDVEIHIYGYDELTMRDIKMIRNAVDLMEETVLINSQDKADAQLAVLQQQLDTEDMSK